MRYNTPETVGEKKRSLHTANPQKGKGCVCVGGGCHVAQAQFYNHRQERAAKDLHCGKQSSSNVGAQ